MTNKKISRRLLNLIPVVSVFMGLPAMAQTKPVGFDAKPANQFHALFRSALPAEMQKEEAFSMIHMVPDASVLLATTASSPQDAIEDVSRSSLDQLVSQAYQSNRSLKLNADDTLAKKPMTMIIVPGIFGEFIPTRAFEDVLSKPSKDRDAFVDSVKSGISHGDPNAQDAVFDIQKYGDKTEPLSDLVNVGSITDSSGRTLVRVVLMYTPFMSLESMGDLSRNAAIFNRRIGKYLALTGADQNLAIVGYSRGTDLSLEMLAQAKAQNLPWLSSVKGMVSLGGVLWGSTLADDTQDPNSPAHAGVQSIKTLSRSLDPLSATSTIAAWTQFALGMRSIAPKLMAHANAPSASDLQASPLGSGMDFTSVLSMVKMFESHIGISNPVGDFANNVLRFQALVNAALAGVQQLTTSARVQWWSTHELPKSVTYYAVTGAMANPEQSELQKTIFDSPFGYSSHSFDDLSLLQNRLDYESKGHIALNDSQVSVAQAMFLPNAIANLNPANAGLKTEFLGTVGTHHWGLALRVVNAMKDGRTNPFPREEMLKALAAQVALGQ